METATLQHNVERAIRFERDASGNGKPILVVDPDSLEIEVFVKVKGMPGEPKSIGVYPASKIHIGESE